MNSSGPSRERWRCFLYQRPVCRYPSLGHQFDTQKDPERVVMVSITTYENYKEDACLLEPGDHPRITRKSCVFYKETRMITLEMLKARFDQGSLSVQPPVTDGVLARIRDGISKSRTIKPKFIDVLLDQGVIE